MNDILRFFDSRDGIFAAVVAAVGLIAAFMGLIRPYLSERRARKTAKAAVVLTEPLLSYLSNSSRSCELRFELANGGKSTAVVTSVFLEVLSHHASSALRATLTEAPIVVYEYRIELHPDTQAYDIRPRLFGPQVPPISLAEGEVEAFVVKLVSPKPHWYEFRIAAEWYDSKLPSAPRIVRTSPLSVDFPLSKKEFPKSANLRLIRFAQGKVARQGALRIDGGDSLHRTALERAARRRTYSSAA